MSRQVEKRAHLRYTLAESAIAVCASHPGHIKDISLGGLAFVSLNGGRSPLGRQTVDIIDGQYEFIMEQVPCRVLADSLIVNESPFNTIRMIRRRIQFEGLTADQQAYLQTYLLAHATEKPGWSFS